MTFSSIRCHLNFSPPTQGLDISSSCNKPPQVAWPIRDDGKWRKQCVLGVACMIIGLQVGNLNDTDAIAEEQISTVVGSSSKVAKWSDKRICPPWKENLLETIVPEDLPRPSARRRWQAIGLSKDAPAVKVKVITKAKTASACFSM